MAHIKTLGLAGAISAALLTIAPAQAADIAPGASATGTETTIRSLFGTGTYDAAAETADYRRRWRGHRRYRRNRIDGGDVLAGVLILGGIAAIASAANNAERRRDRYEDRRYRQDVRRDDRRYRYDDRRRSSPLAGGSGIDSAVEQCLAEIERDVRVDTVDNATRGPSGWAVSGTLFNGSPFTCRIGNDGRIEDVDYGGYAQSGSLEGGAYGANGAAPGQWSDDRYAEARANAPRANPTASSDIASVDPDLAANDEARPAYPGGPLPGETFDD